MPLPNNSLYLATDHLYDTSPPSAGVLNWLFNLEVGVSATRQSAG